ncbi:MAG: glycoside hydrolase family 30 protein [Porticoccaceae bacterium]|nr:glycoside hydrolase family 30 protein [Porticoccaceae bacterium]
MYKYLVILICSIVVVGCDQPVADNTADKSTRDSLTVYTTAKDTDQRLTKTGTFQFKPRVQATEGEISIFVNSSKQFQKFLGIGGSFTDASAEVFAKLDTAKQEEFLKAYYDIEEGIGYSLARTTIHSSDFGSGSHTYIDEGDKSLDTFSIDKDKQFRIPLIKRATEAAGGELLLYASPWSAPAFMKSNNNMLRGGKLLPEYFDSWANYYTKFIKAYESEGMPIWGISIQNEPMATQRWESMIYTAQEERDFLKNHLGPAMEKAGYGDKNIVVWDHNRDLLTDRANVILDDPEAYKYVWGIGYHWYETWTGGDSMHDNLAAVKESYPEVQLLFTEGTVEGFREDRYQYWPNAERYARSMIKDFNIGTVGWTDWNLLLDHTGGPNHVSNFCFAPIHADTRTGELIYTPSYYYIGHFSKFIRPDARRISTSSSRSVLLATSFMNTDNQIATVVMNETDQSIDYHFFADMEQVTLTIPARSMQTLVY